MSCVRGFPLGLGRRRKAHHRRLAPPGAPRAVVAVRGAGRVCAFASAGEGKSGEITPWQARACYSAGDSAEEVEASRVSVQLQLCELTVLAHKSASRAYACSRSIEASLLEAQEGKEKPPRVPARVRAERCASGCRCPRESGATWSCHRARRRRRAAAAACCSAKHECARRSPGVSISRVLAHADDAVRVLAHLWARRVARAA